MRILSFLILPFLFYIFTLFADSPHGKDFKISCNTCHSSKGWTLDKEIYSFDHSKTKLPLNGQHKSVDCKMCHPTLVFSEAKTECANCHNNFHNQSLGNDCGQCHNSDSWLVNNVTGIHQQSRFPLLGVHQTVECQKCHPSESLHRFDVLGVECIDCHRENYMATTNPNHVSGNISTDCSQCHKIYSSDWGGSFNHNNFPLTFGHSNVECIRCHKNGNNYNLSTECYTCHQSDYNSTANPVHSQPCFSTNCTQCHTTMPGWQPVNYNHNNFPLTLGHSNVICANCHTSGPCTTISNDCYSCHQNNYNSTTNPVHTQPCFSVNCLLCHTTNPGWNPVNYGHNNFPLTLGHSNVQCASCHTNGICTTISTDCYSCHQNNYNTTTNPVHSPPCFSTNCTLCHTTSPGWQPVNYSHNNFPLTSGHSNVLCASCHTNGICTTISTDCYSCHQANYNGATNPVHTPPCFSTNCILCHTTSPGWQPVTLNHSNFPLTLGHSNVSCASCHTNGNCAGQSTDCYSCHQTDYNTTTNPAHLGGCYPTNCLFCHTTNPNWTPTSFNHDAQYFPISTGIHIGIACNICHTNPTNCSIFSCVNTCHLNPETNNQHSGVSGYSYLSSACYGCHPHGIVVK